MGRKEGGSDMASYFKLTTSYEVLNNLPTTNNSDCYKITFIIIITSNN